MTDQAERMREYKTSFTDFLMPDGGHGPHMEAIHRMIAEKRKRINVDLADLRAYDGTHGTALARGLLDSPMELLPALHDAVGDIVRAESPKYLQPTDAVYSSVSGSFGGHRVSPRELMSPLLSKLVNLEGIVTRASLVRPKVQRSVHFCAETKQFHTREYRDVTSLTGLPTGSVYPTRDDNNNLLTTEYGLCKYRDSQTVSIQEMPENSPPGILPRSVDVILEDDLVDSCKPGDRVSIVGVYKAAPTKGAGSMSGVFRTLLVANGVRLLGKESAQLRLTAEDTRAIKKVAKRADCFELFAKSLAPSIYGHDNIKRAMVLLLLGGTEKNLKNGTHLRGDINMLMVGDPGVAKSQMLRAVMNIAPLAISTTGRGSSGVGLTAAVTSDKDTGERRLEAGAMVLGDRGVVCIDEFDKMSDNDRVAIHEVMEQQTVTISKAGIHTSLNARCSVVAAANPIMGTYDHNATITKNISLPDSLLSRFDLLFIVLDQMTASVDRSLSEHVLRMHRYRRPGDDGTRGGLFNEGRLDGAMEEDADDEDDGADPQAQGAPRQGSVPVFMKYNRLLQGPLASDLASGESGRKAKAKQPALLHTRFLKLYIAYAKRRQPVLTPAACDQIVSNYVDMRQDASSKTVPITVRALETMIRLATAHAKLKLRAEVTEEDVSEAYDLMRFAVYATECETYDANMRREKQGLGPQAQANAQGNKEAKEAKAKRGGGGDAQGPQPKRPKRAEGGASGAIAVTAPLAQEEEGAGAGAGEGEGEGTGGGAGALVEEGVAGAPAATSGLSAKEKDTVLAAFTTLANADPYVTTVSLEDLVPLCQGMTEARVVVAIDWLKSEGKCGPMDEATGLIYTI